MNFEVNTLEDGTYLVYKVDPTEIVDRYALNTISSNSINGILKMNRENDNGIECFYINVTAKYPLKMMLEKPVRREFLLSIFECIAKTSNDADDYLLNPKYFLFNYENIYYDMSEKKISLIYLPVEREEEELDVKKFLRKMLFDIRYDTREDCNYVASLINLMNSTEVVTMDKLLEVIDNIRKRIVRVPVNPNAAQQIQGQQNHGNVVQPVQPQPGTSFQSQNYQPQQSNQANVNPRPQVPNGAVPNMPPVNGMMPNNIPNTPQQANNAPKKGLFGGLISGKDKQKEVKDKKEKSDNKKGLFGSKNKDNKPANMPQRPGMAIPGMSMPDPTPSAPVPPKPQIPNAQPAYSFEPKQKQPQMQNNGMAIPGSMPIQGQMATPPVQNVAPQVQPNMPVENVGMPPVSSSINIPNNSVGNTVIIGGAAQSGKTVFKKDLQHGPAVAQITRTSTNETAPIKGTQFKIGKEKDYVDFYVSGNPTVSRIHAQINNVGGNYFLEDINSTNHTYLGNDTTPLQSGQQYPLQSGMRFRISDEEFIFKIK